MRYLLSLLLILAAPSYAHMPETTGKTYVLNGKALPLGDGKISTEAKRGYVYSCKTPAGGGGAHAVGPWINGTTWDETQKIAVQGNVAWPSARFSIDSANGKRNLVGNALPVGHTTGIYPIQQSDPAYQIDRNPNAIQEQQVMLSLPLMPTISNQPQCVPMGTIGVALNGVAIFNALDGEGRDAVAHEVQDSCNGHPERQGQYHYHGPSKCIPGAMENSKLIGYALDGFGIYSMFDINGKEISNADLDECHGRIAPVMWDGKMVEMYHYVLTREYPYTIGCFRGTPVMQQRQGGGQPPMGGMGGGNGGGMNGGPGGMNGGPGMGAMRQPPAEAIKACSGFSNGAFCGFTSPRGDNIKGTCRTIGSTTACVPAGMQP